MNLIELPFSRLIGIRRSNQPGALLELRDEPQLHNHLAQFHAAALFSLAEASSAEFLLRHRGPRVDIQGVVRKARAKYSLPAQGTLTSDSSTDADRVGDAIAAVDAKGRALLTVEITLRNADHQSVATFSFDWFLTKLREE